jgi:DNA polymerase III alpha subunit
MKTQLILLFKQEKDMGQKKLVKELIKKLDRLEKDREKLITKLAKALDKLEKKEAPKADSKKPVTKKAPLKKAPSEKRVTKKTSAPPTLVAESNS